MTTRPNTSHALWQLNGSDSLFEHLKTSEWKADVRLYFEKLYDDSKSKNLIDKHFLKDFGNHLIQRWWELFIGTWLEFQFKEAIVANSVGPDFSITSGNDLIHVECIAPWPSQSDQKVRHSRNGPHATWLNRDPYIAMVTSAVRTKHAKLYCDQKKNAVRKSDPLVIAINLSTAHDVDIAEFGDTSILFQALLGLGPTAMKVPVSFSSEPSDVKVTTVQTYRNAIQSKNNSEIPTNEFLSDRYKRVSGVLFSIERYVDCADPFSPKLKFLHNPFASNTLPHGVFSDVTEFAVKDGLLVEIKRSYSQRVRSWLRHRRRDLAKLLEGNVFK